MIHTVIKHLETIKHDKKLSYYTKVEQICERVNKQNVSNFLDAFKDEFTKQGIRYINATFSGGHDEGGYDTFSYLDNKEEEVILKDCENHNYLETTLVKSETLNNKKDVVKQDIFYYENYKHTNLKTFDLENIFYKLGALERFGSFAGEFSVDGEVTLDVITGKYKMTGNETIEEYQAIKSEGDIHLTKKDAA